MVPKIYNSVNGRTTAAGGAAASSHSATLDIAPGTAHTGVEGAPLAMAVPKLEQSLKEKEKLEIRETLCMERSRRRTDVGMKCNQRMAVVGEGSDKKFGCDTSILVPRLQL